MEAFPKVFHVIRELFFRPSDGAGDFLCRKRTFLQKGADLIWPPMAPLVCAFLPGDMAHDGLDRQGVRYEVGAYYVIRNDRPCFFARGFVGHNVPILSKRNRLCDIASSRTARRWNRIGTILILFPGLFEIDDGISVLSARGRWGGTSPSDSVSVIEE
jgi:hypothetical protein